MRPSRLHVLLLLLPAMVAACSETPAGERLSLHYTVVARPGYGFDVELRASGVRGKPEFRMLNGWGMIQDQPGHVEGVEAWDRDGASVPIAFGPGEEESLWKALRSPGGELRLAYRVASYDANLAPHASFVSKDRLLLLGTSIFLVPAEIDHAETLSIEVEMKTPEGWEVWTSWPGTPGTSTPGSIRELWGGVAAAGDYLSTKLSGGSHSVTVLTEGSGNRTLGLGIANRLFPVLREMIALFGSPPQGPSLDVLAVYRTMPRREGKSVIIGTSEEGAFLCIATPERYAEPLDLTSLAAHECLHFYLGGAVTASPEPPYRNSPDLVWLMEGVTEYLSYRLMERAGVLSSEQLREVGLDKERRFRENPHAGDISMADAARAMLDMETYSLVYTRGYLVSRYLDREMESRCGEGALDRVLRRLFEERRFDRTGEPVTRNQVRAIFEAECPGSFGTVEMYAEGNRPLPLDSMIEEPVGVLGN